ncbi:replication initiation protein [Campylobacter jejuni]
MQSYIFTAAKYDFTAYEKRIMYRLVECAQDEIAGIKIKDHMHKILPVQLGREITLPTSSILRDEKDENYTIAKKAFLSLSKKHIIYEDEDYWMATPIITKPKVSKKEGTVTFLVFDEIWKCILDFTKGYRKYELITAMQFKSVYSMRFYELMSGQIKPLFVPLEGPDGLRERFGLQGKYKLTADFKRKVLDVAKAELDESSPFSFVAQEKTEGKKIIGWTLYPVFYEDREDPALQEQARMAKVTARLQLDDEIYNYLKFSYKFDSKEINRNKKTLVDGQNRIPNFIDFLAGLKGGAREARSEKAYVIGAIKTKLKEIK